MPIYTRHQHRTPGASSSGLIIPPGNLSVDPTIIPGATAYYLTSQGLNNLAGGKIGALAATAAPPVKPSPAGPIRLLNGTSQVLSRTDTGFPTGDLTVACLFQWKGAALISTTGNAYMVNWGVNTATGDLVGLYIGSTSGTTFIGRLAATQWGASANNASAPRVDDGKVHAAVMTRKSGSWTVYCDGAIHVGPTALTSNTVLGGTFTIGHFASDGIFFNGWIDNVIIWPRALGKQDALWLTKEPFALLRPAFSPVRKTPATGTTYANSLAEGTESAAETLTDGGALFGGTLAEGSASATHSQSAIALFVGPDAEGSATGAETLSTSGVLLSSLSEGSASGADTPAGALALPASLAEGTASASEAESSAALFGAADAEGSASGTETLSTLGVLGVSRVEGTATAAETETTAKVMPSTLSEGTATAAETDAAAAAFAGTLGETGSAADTTSGLATFGAQAADTGSAADTPASALVALAANVESRTASDTPSAAALFDVTRLESGSAAETETSNPAFPISLDEGSASAADTTSSAAAFASSPSEGSASAADTPSSLLSTATFVAGEAGNAVDAQSSLILAGATLAETGSAAETLSGSVNTALTSLADTGSAADTETGALLLSAALTETGTATDAAAAVAILAAAAAEGSATASESMSAFVGSGIAEIGHASDAPSALLVAPVALAESGAASEAMATGIARSVVLAETGAASDLWASSGAQGTTSMSEAGAADDSWSTALQAGVALAEAGSAFEEWAALYLIDITSGDGQIATDAIVVTGTMLAQLEEAGLAAATEISGAPPEHPMVVHEFCDVAERWFVRFDAPAGMGFQWSQQMPQLDVSDVIGEALFTEDAVWIKRSVYVRDDGIGDYTETRVPIKVIPTAGDGSTLERDRDGGIVHHRQRFYTIAELSPGVSGMDADRVLWGGRLYQVSSVGDWTRWGQGYVSAACELIPPDGGVRDDRDLDR